MWFTLADASVVQLAQANYDPNDAFAVNNYHLPKTDVSLLIDLGMPDQEWTVTGYITSGAGNLDTPMPFDVTQIVAVSIDGTTWRTCHSTNLRWPLHRSNLHQYELTLLVSPLRYGATHTSSTYWGWTTATVPAATGAGLMRLSYQGPTRFWPLINSLASVDGINLTYTGTPIFSNGLIVGVGVKASAAIAAKSLAMRLLFYPYSFLPSAWVVGGTGGNLLTANESSVETDLTGLESVNATLTRDATIQYAGAYSARLSSITANGAQVRTTYVNVTAGTIYVASMYVTNWVGAAGKLVVARIEWFNAASVSLGTVSGATVTMAYDALSRVSAGAMAPATATKCKISAVFTDSVSPDAPFVDALMIESIALPAYLYLWQSAHNSCFIDTAAGAVKWTDGTTTISRTINLAAYLAGGSLDVVAIDDTAETLVVIQAGTAATATGTLAALTWGTLNVGSDGSANEAMAAISYITAYPYALASAEYQALHLTANPLTLGTLSIYFRSSGVVTVNNQGRLIDSIGNDVSAGMAGPIPTGVSGSAGSLVMSDGLSARWQVLIDDTWRV